MNDLTRRTWCVLWRAGLALTLSACDDVAVVVLDGPFSATSAQPNLVVDGAGGAVLSWLEVDGPHTVLKAAVLENENWVNVRDVTGGKDWFVNWADFPSVVPIDEEHWVAHWLVRNRDAPFAYDVFVSTSTDAGVSWSAGRLLHDDGTASEHGFVSIVPGPAGADVIWLDGRDIANETRTKSMTLRIATLASTGSILNGGVVDGRVCDCCSTDAVRTNKGVVIVYRDRSADEIRDISIVRDVGGRWSIPRRVARDGWRIDGCPVNGPAVDAKGEMVVVAWPTGVGDDARVRFARSIDAGVSFPDVIDIDDVNPVGRVDVVLLGDGRAVVSWMRRREGDAALSFRTVGVDGELGRVHDIASMSAERAAGFPQMISVENRLVFAWTDPAKQRVRTAVASLATLSGQR